MQTRILFTSLVCCLSLATSANAQLNRYEYDQFEMGVSFRIVLYARDKAAANQAATAAYSRINKLNAILSDYDRNSELMRLCETSTIGKPAKVSPELQYVLCRSLALSNQTKGAFDVTVGPLVQLWRRSRRQKQLPTVQRLADSKRRTGYHFLQLDSQHQTVEFLKDRMRLDLGGIAKGYATDEALKILKNHGITRALVDGSGDIVLGDPPPGKDGWRIAISTSDNSKNDSETFLELSNVAVATSGDAFQHVEINGTRYSHIIDPKTGLGLTTPSTVTIIAPDGITADSLASAVSVLGPEKGIQLIEKLTNTETQIVIVQGKRTRTFATCGFVTYLSPQKRDSRND